MFWGSPTARPTCSIGLDGGLPHFRPERQLYKCFSPWIATYLTLVDGFFFFFFKWGGDVLFLTQKVLPNPPLLNSEGAEHFGLLFRAGRKNISYRRKRNPTLWSHSCCITCLDEVLFCSKCQILCVCFSNPEMSYLENHPSVTEFPNYKGKKQVEGALLLGLPTPSISAASHWFHCPLAQLGVYDFRFSCSRMEKVINLFIRDGWEEKL